MRAETIKLIFDIAGRADAFDALERGLRTMSRAQLSRNIVECGILPEEFEQNSSEEKLWAKYSDILLAHCLSFLGVKARVLRARGNAADVFGETKTYTIVADAKTFRLSRTAKNQKDFKVSALDDWRRNDTYALLAAPLSQYPSHRSQIYSQAVRKNVTLLSYVHIKYLLDNELKADLSELWQVGTALGKRTTTAEAERSENYWQAIDKAVCSITQTEIEELQRYKAAEVIITRKIGRQGINFWRHKIEEYKHLSHAEAIARLVKAEKIEAKIRTIEVAINQDYSAKNVAP